MGFPLFALVYHKLAKSPIHAEPKHKRVLCCRNVNNYGAEPQSRRQVIEKIITFVGLDVHKNTIGVALADTGRNAEVRHYTGLSVAVLIAW